MAAGGVIVSLVYLAGQIRQNTRAMRGSAHEASVARNTAWAVAIGSDAQVADLLARGHKEYEDLSLAERIQFGHLMSAIVLGAEATYLQYQRGNLEEMIFQRALATLPSFAESQGFQAWWKSAHFSFTTDFQAIVTGAIEEAANRPNRTTT